MKKVAAAQGSGLPDPTKSEAAAMPSPPASVPMVVGNAPAPGQTGPRGLAPRTTYSRVNTGSIPTPSVGTEGKSSPPRGMESLPKIASKESNFMATMSTRPTLQELVKAAMDGTVSKVNIAAAGARALGHQAPTQTKVASASSVVSADVIEKTAAALEFLAKKAADPGSVETASPGVGPGMGGGQVMEVLKAESSQENVDAGQLGSATAKHQVPMSPAMTSFADSKSAPNAMETNIDMQHAEQPVDPMNNETASNEAQKTSAVLAYRNMAVLRKLAMGEEAVGAPADVPLAVSGGLPGATEEEQDPAIAVAQQKLEEASAVLDEAKAASAYENNLRRLGLNKQASAVAYARNLAALGLRKQAEDAINKASITASTATAQGATPPSGVSASEEGPVPAVPSDMSRQENLIGSNDAAINYTKAQAKADPKRDLGQVLTEPALTSSTDKGLSAAFANTSNAGAKVASASMLKTAAAHALLLKLAACKSKMGGEGEPEGAESECASEEECAAEDKKKKMALLKEKMSQMGSGNLSTPAGQSGFNAATMGM